MSREPEYLGLSVSPNSTTTFPSLRVVTHLRLSNWRVRLFVTLYPFDLLEYLSDTKVEPFDVSEMIVTYRPTNETTPHNSLILCRDAEKPAHKLR